MLVSFDTEKEDLEQLKKALEILQQAVLNKAGNKASMTQQSQPVSQQPTPSCFQNNVQKEQPRPTSIQAQQAQTIFSMAGKIDMSKIYQSNAGIQKKREMLYRHNR